MKKILLSVMTLVLVLGLVGAGAFALFSDRETSGVNKVRAGSVEITLGGDIGGGFTVINMAPGAKVTKRLTVTNTGTLPIWFSSYISTYNGTSGFINQFDLVVTVPDGVGYYGNIPGMGNTEAWSGPLENAFGKGATLGVEYPPLPSGKTAVYDFVFTLDVNTGNTYQNAWLDAWITVDAVQFDNIDWAAAKAFLT